MNSTASPPGFRISLREFLLLVTTFTIACAALKYANGYWLAVVSLATLLAFIAATVVAVVDRGPRQTFAVGFLVAVAIYAGLIHSRKPEGAPNNFVATNPEFDPYRGVLPTTLLLRPLFEAVVVNWYFDRATGNRIDESQLPPGATIDYYGGGASANVCCVCFW